VVVVRKRSRSDDDGGIRSTRQFHELATDSRSNALVTKLGEGAVGNFNATFERRAFKASRSLKNAVVFRKVSDPWRTISNHVVVLNIHSQYFGTIRHRRKSRVV